MVRIDPEKLTGEMEIVKHEQTSSISMKVCDNYNKQKILRIYFKYDIDVWMLVEYKI